MPRPPTRPQLWSALLGVLFSLLLAACAPTQTAGGGGSRRVTPPPEPRQVATPAPDGTATAPVSQGTARVRGSAMSATDLYLAYRGILDNFVDPVDGAKLTQAAAETLRTSLQQQPLLPLFTLPLSMLPAPSGNADRDWQAFGSAYEAVVNKLPAWSAEHHPDWMVVRSMAESVGDGHTTFLTPDEVRRREETSFAGIGVLLSRPQDNQPPLVAEVFPNSPAAAGGVKRGDRIMAVDGQEMAGRTVADVAQTIRGPRGTDVRVRIKRASQTEPTEMTLRRATVQVEQVAARQVPNTPIGYLRIRAFSDDSVAEQTLGVLETGRQRGVRAWIVDLRGNSGGALRSVIATAAGFLDADHTVVGYQVDRLRHQEPLSTQPMNLVRDSAAIVFLVDRDTASGAEILAAAVREANLAQLVGTRTAGNVGVATQIELADRSRVQVTEQRFVSPSGAQIDGVGVAPDVVVELTDEDLENDRDPQLTRALEIVLAKLRG